MFLVCYKSSVCTNNKRELDCASSQQSNSICNVNIKTRLCLDTAIVLILF